MSVYDTMAGLSAIDWFVVCLATTVSLIGMLLPRIGNFIGRAVLGEDPLLRKWQQARLARKARLLADRQAKRGDKAGRKGPKAAPTGSEPPTPS